MVVVKVALSQARILVPHGVREARVLRPDDAKIHVY
jgi:hypothetical protein